MALDPRYASKDKRRVERTLREMIHKADVDFERDKRKVVEYRTSRGKEFTANPATRGAYAAD